MLINFLGEILRSSGHRAKLLKMLQWILCPPIMGGGCRFGKSFLQLKISIGRGGRRWVINAWSTMSEHCKQMLYNFFRNVRRLKEHIFKKFLNFNILCYFVLNIFRDNLILWFELLASVLQQPESHKPCWTPITNQATLTQSSINHSRFWLVCLTTMFEPLTLTAGKNQWCEFAAADTRLCGNFWVFWPFCGFLGLVLHPALSLLVSA